MINKSLTLEDIKQLKIETEKEIFRLIDEFQKNTSLQVDRINTNRSETGDGRIWLTSVNIDVSLK